MKKTKVKKNNKFRSEYLIYIFCGISVLLAGYKLYGKAIQAKKNNEKLNFVQLIPTTTIVDENNCVKNSHLINGECWCDDGYTMNETTGECESCPPNTWGKYSFCYCNDGYEKNKETGQCDKIDESLNNGIGLTQKDSVSLDVNSKQIDCIGPDGKHLQTTEIECKKFNDAWSIKIPTVKRTSSSIYVPSNNTNIPQYMPDYQYIFQPNLSDQPNPVQQYEAQRKQKCLEDTIKYNTCIAEYNVCMTKKINDPYAYCSNLCSKPYCSY